MMELFSSVFTGMSGRYTRMRIICAITDEPMNTLELSKKLEMDYKTIQHNIKVLESNSFIVREGEGYGDLFFPSDLITSNLPGICGILSIASTIISGSIPFKIATAKAEVAL